MENALLTTSEAAIRLGVSAERVRQFIKAGRLPSKQYGSDHVIIESDLALVANRKVGRPTKKQASVAVSDVSATSKAPDHRPAATAKDVSN